MIENFTLSWPCCWYRLSAVNTEREKNLSHLVCHHSNCCCYTSGNLQWSPLDTENEERRRNNWKEGRMQLKDPAAGPSEAWESLILFLMYVWSPHISLTYKASLKNVGNRWSGKLAKSEKECWVTCANIMCCAEPYFSSCNAVNHIYLLNVPTVSH